MSINEDLVRTKAMFRKHFMVYLFLIIVLGVVNLFIFSHHLWILYFAVGWGFIILVHYLYVRKKTHHYKKSDSEFLKTKATELKSGIPDYSKINEQTIKSEFVKGKEEPKPEPAVQDEEPIDMEKLEIAEVDIIRPRSSKNTKKQKSARNKTPIKRRPKKKQTVSRKKTGKKPKRKPAKKKIKK